MKQLFAVSSLPQLVNLHAAIESGLIEAAEERILLITDYRTINEVGPSFADSPFAAPLLDVFDRRIDLKWIHPYHPSQWGPRDSDIPVWTTFFSRAEVRVPTCVDSEACRANLYGLCHAQPRRIEQISTRVAASGTVVRG